MATAKRCAVSTAVWIAVFLLVQFVASFFVADWHDYGTSVILPAFAASVVNHLRARRRKAHA
jgi:hypothetical protein